MFFSIAKQTKRIPGMKVNLKYLQYLFFWLSACLPFAIMAAASANQSVNQSAGAQ
jgi:hypothetical protein